MPRKKAAAADPTSPGAFASAPTNVLPAMLAPISCPACKSKISADGKTLHDKSAYLEELLETDAGVDEVEKNVVALEKKLAAANQKIAELQAQLEDKSKAAAPAPQKETANVGKEQKRKSWWD